MTTEPQAPLSVPLDQLLLRRDVWPRIGLDRDRVELFAAHWGAGETLPPIEVVPFADGRYLIADGVHRSYAARQAGLSEISGVIVIPEVGGGTHRLCLPSSPRDG